jgi:hypothetical protein
MRSFQAVKPDSLAKVLNSMALIDAEAQASNRVQLQYDAFFGERGVREFFHQSFQDPILEQLFCKDFVTKNVDNNRRLFVAVVITVLLLTIYDQNCGVSAETLAIAWIYRGLLVLVGLAAVALSFYPIYELYSLQINSVALVFMAVMEITLMLVLHVSVKSYGVSTIIMCLCLVLFSSLWSLPTLIANVIIVLYFVIASAAMTSSVPGSAFLLAGAAVVYWRAAHTSEFVSRYL